MNLIGMHNALVVLWRRRRRLLGRDSVCDRDRGVINERALGILKGIDRIYIVYEISKQFKIKTKIFSIKFHRFFLHKNFKNI